MTAPTTPTIEELFQRVPETDREFVRKNYDALTARYSLCRLPYFLFAFAHHGTAPSPYGGFLHNTFRAAVTRDLGLNISSDAHKGTVSSIAAGTSKGPLTEQTNKNARAVVTAISLHMARYGLTPEDIFTPNHQGTSPDYGKAIENIQFSHPAFAAKFAEQPEIIQKHYYELKRKYPNADNDYALLIVAQHTKKPIFGSNSGISETVSALKFPQLNNNGINFILSGTGDPRYMTYAQTFLVVLETKFKLEHDSLRRPFAAKQRRTRAEEPKIVAQQDGYTVRNTEHFTPVNILTPYNMFTQKLPTNLEDIFAYLPRLEMVTNCALLPLKRYIAIQMYRDKHPIDVNALLQKAQKTKPQIKWDNVYDFIAGKTEKYPAKSANGEVSLQDFFEAFANVIGEGYTAAELEKEYNARIAAVTPKPSRPARTAPKKHATAKPAAE